MIEIRMYNQGELFKIVKAETEEQAREMVAVAYHVATKKSDVAAFTKGDFFRKNGKLKFCFEIY